MLVRRFRTRVWFRLGATYLMFVFFIVVRTVGELKFCCSSDISVVFVIFLVRRRVRNLGIIVFLFLGFRKVDRLVL